MRDLGHHSPDRRCVFPFDHLIQPGKAQALDHELVLDRRADFRAHVLELNCLLLCRHVYSSCSVLPRRVATSWRSRSLKSASNVALITLCGLAVPIDLVRTFCMPTEVITARTAPPAITPVPSGAGLSNTRPEPNVPSTACGIEVLVRFTRIRFFLADSIPLRMACGTSLALPEPYPTPPALWAPTTTNAANDMFLPPLATLVPRLMATTWSFNW